MPLCGGYYNSYDQKVWVKLVEVRAGEVDRGGAFMVGPDRAKLWGVTGTL